MGDSRHGRGPISRSAHDPSGAYLRGAYLEGISLGGEREKWAVATPVRVATPV